MNVKNVCFCCETNQIFKIYKINIYFDNNLLSL